MKRQSIKEESLETVLQITLANPQINCYAIALARSLVDLPNQSIVNMLIALIETEGVKWLEVLRRLACKDYGFIFVACITNVKAYPVLIKEAKNYASKYQIECLRGKIDEMMGNDHYNANLKWLIYSLFLQADIIEILEILKTLQGNLIQSTDRGQSFARQLAALKYSQLTSQTPPKGDQLVTVYAIYNQITRLYKQLSDQALRKLQYLPLTHEYSMLVKWLKSCLQQTITYVVSFTDYKNQLELVYYEDGIKFIIDSSSINQLTTILQNQKRLLVDWLLSVQLLQQDRLKIPCQNTAQQMLNLQYGLIYQQYGDDLPSILSKCLLVLAERVDGFLKTMFIVVLELLNRVVNINSQMYIKLCIVNKLLLVREDLVVEYVMEIMDKIFDKEEERLEKLEELDRCRKLRLLHIYCEQLNQKKFQRCLDICLGLLREDDCLSLRYTEACFIFQEMLKKRKNISKVPTRVENIVQMKAGTVCEDLMSIVMSQYGRLDRVNETKMEKLLSLLSRIIYGYQRATAQACLRFLKTVCQLLTAQLKKLWSLGRKTSPILHSLIDIYHSTCKHIDQDNYIDYESNIFDVLYCLKQPNHIECEQTMLQILSHMLHVSKCVTQFSCECILQLNKIVECNEGNLFSILCVVKQLCGKQLVDNVLYNWCDMVKYLAKIFIQFCSQTLSHSFINTYPDYWLQISSTMQLYIQSYEEYISQNNELIASLLDGISFIMDSQIKLQLLITLNHIKWCNMTNLLVLDNTQLTYRYSVKLVYILFVDTLLQRYDTEIVTMLCQFHQKHYQNYIEKVYISNQYLDVLPLAKLSIKEYVLDGLRMLRCKHLIDNSEHMMLLRQLLF